MMRTSTVGRFRLRYVAWAPVVIAALLSTPPAQSGVNENLVRPAYKYPVRVYFEYLGCRSLEHCREDDRVFSGTRKAECETDWAPADLKKRFLVGFLEIRATGKVTFHGSNTPATCLIASRVALINSAVARSRTVPLEFHNCSTDRFRPCQAVESGHPGIAAAVMQFFALPTDLYPTHIEEGAGQ